MADDGAGVAGISLRLLHCIDSMVDPSTARETRLVDVLGAHVGIRLSVRKRLP